MSLTRRNANDHPLPNRLPQRTPGAALAELEADQWRGRAEVAERELEVTVAENKMLGDDLAATVAECDALETQSLPWLDSPNWPQTSEPVGALLADEVAADLGFKGW